MASRTGAARGGERPAVWTVVQDTWGFRTDRVLSQSLRDWVSEDRLACGCRNVGACTMEVVWGSLQTGVGLRGQEKREAGHLLTSLWNHLHDITEVARRSLGSTLAKCSINSWIGSWNGKRASVEKLVKCE